MRPGEYFTFTLSQSKLDDLSSGIIHNIFQLSILRNGKPMENLFIQLHGHCQPLDSRRLPHGPVTQQKHPEARTDASVLCPFPTEHHQHQRNTYTLEGKILFLSDTCMVGFQLQEIQDFYSNLNEDEHNSLMMGSVSFKLQIYLTSV